MYLAQLYIFSCYLHAENTVTSLTGMHDHVKSLPHDQRRVNKYLLTYKEVNK